MKNKFIKKKKERVVMINFCNYCYIFSFILFSFLFFFSLGNFVFASDGYEFTLEYGLFVDTEYSFDYGCYIDYVLPFKYNEYYLENYVNDGFEPSDSYLYLYNLRTNDYIFNEMNFEGDLIFKIDPRDNKYNLIFNEIQPGDSQELVSSIMNDNTFQIQLCDFDNVCEPCEFEFCHLNENYAVCSDCSSGTFDNYCDLEKDGICDPDCNGKDIDCETCSQTGCFDNLEDEIKTCSDLKGTPCSYGSECSGEWLYSDDFGNLCCSKKCVNEKKERDDSLYLNEVMLEDINYSYTTNLDKSDYIFEKYYDYSMDDIIKYNNEDLSRNNDIYEDNYDEIINESSVLDENESIDFVINNSTANTNNSLDTSYNKTINWSIIFSFVVGIFVFLSIVVLYFSKKAEFNYNNPLIKIIYNLKRNGYDNNQIFVYMKNYNYSEKNVIDAINFIDNRKK
jgi:hypothetical protein